MAKGYHPSLISVLQACLALEGNDVVLFEIEIQSPVDSGRILVALGSTIIISSFVVSIVHVEIFTLEVGYLGVVSDVPLLFDKAVSIVVEPCISFTNS